MSKQRLIDANAFLERKKRLCNFETLKNWVDVEPTIDPIEHGYVPVNAYEQIKWERDTAIRQLESYGVNFGEKAEMQRVRHGKWISEEDKSMMVAWERCSDCGLCTVDMNLNYCPNCGCKMDKE